MTHPRVLDPNHAALLVVDIQEAFRKYVGDFERFVDRAVTVVRGFQILELPVFVTEQYPKGLGRTVSEIRDVLPEDFDYLEKTAFSSCGASQLEQAFRDAGSQQIVICGLETHVCVNQTVHDLLDREFDVHILTDCVASRAEENRQTALAKMFASGAVQSSIEMALFELMRDSTHAKFKEIQQLIK